jgi:hypothetical protein
MPTVFVAPSEDHLTEIARKWVAVDRLVNEEYGASLTSELATLALLQRVLDDDLVDVGYGMQCVEGVLGRIMAANIPGLDWAVAKDDLGIDICLRYADTSLCVFPIGMISKRIARGERVDVQDLYDATRTNISGLANEVE